MSKSDKIYLIDGMALAYRSYYAFIRNPLINSKGENTGALFGFANTVLSILKNEEPDFIAAVFDTPEPTFRHKIYKEYKATRSPMPDEMRPQIQWIKDILSEFNIPVIQQPGFEADDIIGTIAKAEAGENRCCFIVTKDKDFFQLVNDNIKIFTLGGAGTEKEIIGIDEVEAKTGVKPSLIIDWLALMGDKSDNVPGITGVGEKTALKLIKQYGSVESLKKDYPEMKSGSLKNKIESSLDMLDLSKELVTIKTDVPVHYSLNDFSVHPLNVDSIRKQFLRFEFSSLLDQLPGDSIENESDYYLINSEEELKELTEKIIKEASCLSFDLETTGTDPYRAEIVGFSLAFKEKVAYYIPVKFGLLSGAGLDLPIIKKFLNPVLASDLKKCGQNIKYDLTLLLRNGFEVNGIYFDTMIASYLIDPANRQHNLDNLAFKYLNYRKIPTSELIGTGKKQISMRDVELDKIKDYACEDADITLRLKNVLAEKLKEANLFELFEQIEMPLVEILQWIESNGVKVDIHFLSKMSREIADALRKKEHEIFERAGENFNINSPLQLGKILFDKLQIHSEFGRRKPPKTKTGGYKTDITVLQSYSDHPLPALVLDYRELAKLQSTYVDALSQLINPFTGKIHTSFNQTIAATGRLSSSNPNLQNIPIRKEFGREIRKAFVASEPDSVIFSADYSQIELRIMAHLANDQVLIESFNNNEDVHKRTASLVFGIPIDEVTDEMRYRAKAVNFGIMYGMSKYRLSRDLKIGIEEADNFIHAYFAHYPGINRYITDQIARARETGIVKTLLGRKREIPEITSENQRVRNNAENIAVNTPIQGTAADMIKVAMINIARAIHNENIAAKMILQIHDELVFEIKNQALKRAEEIIVDEMESALSLKVPLKVDTGYGKNWFEAH